MEAITITAKELRPGDIVEMRPDFADQMEVRSTQVIDEQIRIDYGGTHYYWLDLERRILVFRSREKDRLIRFEQAVRRVLQDHGTSLLLPDDEFDCCAETIAKLMEEMMEEEKARGSE